MKLKHIEETDCRLRDVWNVHAFARRDRKNKMQQSRLKMLMGFSEGEDGSTAEAAGRWW